MLFCSFYVFLVASNGCLSGDAGIEILCRVVKRYVDDRLQLSLLLLIIAIFFDELQNTVSSLRTQAE